MSVAPIVLVDASRGRARRLASGYRPAPPSRIGEQIMVKRVKKGSGKKAIPKAPKPPAAPSQQPVRPASPSLLPFTLPTGAKSARKPPGPAETRRSELRETEFGGNVDEEIWHKREKGFCTIPRTLPLLCTLIRELAKGADAARIYLDLWGRQYEDGFVEIHDEEEIAASCGYHSAHRGIRYWRKGMSELVRLGFIEVKPKNTRKYGYILLHHPDDVVNGLTSQPRSPVPVWWLGLYGRRCRDIGAKKRKIAKAD